MSMPMVSLKNVANFVNGKAFKPTDWSEEGIPIIRIQNLNGLDKPYNYWAGPLDKEVHVKRNDLLLAWSGTPGTSFGAHIWRGGAAVLNQHIFRVDLKENLVTKEWAKFVINAQLSTLIGMAHGGVGLKHVTKGMVEGLEIPVPPLPEQRRIAAILDQADALRAKRREALAQLDSLTQSIFIEMFGDPDLNPKGWTLGRIRDILESASYGTSEKSSAEGEFPVLRMNNITRSGELDFQNLKYMNLPLKDHERYLVKAGDVLFNRTNSAELVGKTAMVPDASPKLAYAGYLVRLRVNAENNPAYLARFLNTAYAKRMLRGMCKSIIGMANINATEIQAMQIAIPPSQLQQTFATRIQSVESLRATHRAALAELDTLFASLQHRAFAGEL